MMRLLNIGSSARVADGWKNVDFNWLARLSTWPVVAKVLYSVGVLSDSRYQRIKKINGNIIVHDIRKRLPFDNASFDVVYHSHVLEHLDKSSGKQFISECCRILCDGGTVRIVVPDLELLIQRYIRELTNVRNGGTRAAYDKSMSDLFDQMVSRIPSARAKQNLLTRAIECLFVGSTYSNGECHQWMYDCWSLGQLLEAEGFSQIKIVDAFTSRIQEWDQWFLDVNQDGSVYKDDSVYIEATK